MALAREKQIKKQEKQEVYQGKCIKKSSSKASPPLQVIFLLLIK